MSFKFAPLLFFFLLTGIPASCQIVNIEELRITGTNDTIRWYGNLRASANIIKIRGQSLAFSGNGRLQYRNKRHLALLLAHYDLLRSPQNDIVNNTLGHLRYNYRIYRTWTWEAFGQAQSNPLQSLQQRYLLGSGIRKKFPLDASDTNRMYLGAASLWEYNTFGEAFGMQYWNRFSTYLSFFFRLAKNSTLSGTTYWQPVWGQAANYRMSTDWLLKVGITKRVALTIDFSYQMDNNLPPDAPKENYFWRNGLSIEW